MTKFETIATIVTKEDFDQIAQKIAEKAKENNTTASAEMRKAVFEYLGIESKTVYRNKRQSRFVF